MEKNEIRITDKGNYKLRLWNPERLQWSLKELNSLFKRLPKPSYATVVMWDGKLTKWENVNKQLSKHYPDCDGIIGSNIPKYTPKTQYLVFTATGWAVADKPSFDEEE